MLALGRRYGELDGEMSWMYAMAFAKVGRTLTPDQRAACVKLRNLDGYHSAPAYLYSNPLTQRPAVPNSDFLFGAPASAAATSSATTTRDAATPPATAQLGFVLRSPAVADGGPLPKTFTGDGESATLPLEWSGAPDGTKSYAIIMHHLDPEGKTKWYWVLYNIPAEVRSLSENVRHVGILGNNSINGRVGYAPPHSKGPGPKTYVYTVYALSEPVKLDVPPSEVSREVLLAGMKEDILAMVELKVVYSRTLALSEPVDPAKE